MHWSSYKFFLRLMCEFERIPIGKLWKRHIYKIIQYELGREYDKVFSNVYRYQ